MAFTVISVLHAEDRTPTVSLACYPETIMPGDMVYVDINFHNHHKEKIVVPTTFSRLSNGNFSYRCSVKEWDMPLLSINYHEYMSLPLMRINNAEMEPDETMRISMANYSIPSLEDLQKVKYVEFMDALPEEGKEITLHITLFSETNIMSGKRKPVTLEAECKLKIKKRPPAEMKLLEEWYNHSASEPSQSIIRYDGEIPIRKGDNPIRKNGFALGTGYPGKCNEPESCAGWKALEESFQPCTLRDEIQLKRIMFCYNETKDNEILSELESWLKEKNELQRLCLRYEIITLKDFSAANRALFNSLNIDFFEKTPRPDPLLDREIREYIKQEKEEEREKKRQTRRGRK